jgi:hypothetical protein
MNKVNHQHVGSRTIIRPCTSLVFFLCMTGCAIQNSKNRVTTNWVEENMWPESSGGKVLAVPVVFPAQTAALVLDAVLVHPLRSLDEAGSATTREVWSNMDWGNRYMTQCAALPWRMVWTPVAFSSHWLANSIFDMEAAKSGPEAGEQIGLMIKKLGPLRDDLTADNAEEVLIELKRMRQDYKSLAFKPGDVVSIREFKLKYFRLFMKVTDLAGQYDDLTLPSQRWIDFRDPELYDNETNEILNWMHVSTEPMARWAALRIEMLAASTPSRVQVALGRVLQEPDPVIRYNALMMINKFYPPNVVEIIRPMLMDLSKNDVSGMVRDGAAQILRWLEYVKSIQPSVPEAN